MSIDIYSAAKPGYTILNISYKVVNLKAYILDFTVFKIFE